MSPVSVCLCTYKRLDSLKSLLEDLAAQTGGPGVAEVVVVDNDAAASARELVEGLAQHYPVPLRYAVQPVQNIALTRNLGVELARGEWIAMIDDDERAPPDWLALLAATAQAQQADGVFGPVLYRLPEQTPGWLQRHDFFAQPRFATGSQPPPAKLYTNNVLIRRRTLCSEPGPFDPHYGLSGGSDVDLMSRLHAGGAKLVWCDEAAVSEVVEADRLNARWILRRYYRGGQNFAGMTLSGRFGPSTWGSRAALAMDVIVKLLLAVPLCLLALPLPKHLRVLAASKLATQCGKASAFFGGHYEEYKNVRAQP